MSRRFNREPLSSEERDARRKTDRDRLEQTARALLTTEGWQRWIRVRATNGLSRYSVGNQMLIAIECHARGITPTYVAGFRAFLDLNRCVRKGEKAIRILAPVTVKQRDEPGEKKVFFRTAPVFDVSMTDVLPGKQPIPLSSPSQPIEGDTHAHLVAPLQELGYGVEIRALPEHGPGGWCDAERKQIVVADGPANGIVRTLVHEVAHALGIGYEQYGREQAEVLVDCATYVVCSSVGLDVGSESIAYVAGWGEDGALDAIKAYAATIDAVARRIEDARQHSPEPVDGVHTIAARGGPWTKSGQGCLRKKVCETRKSLLPGNLVPKLCFVMPANAAIQETELIDGATAWLAERMPATWTVERAKRDAINVPEAPTDALIELRAPNGIYTTLAVEARTSMEPRDVGAMLPGIARSLRTLAGHVPLLVVAPWLSARTRELLAEQSINYLDSTGNALLKLDNPAVFIKSDGAQRNPNPEPRGPASIRGPRAGRLVRLLADVRPPYAVGEIAAAADLNPGYVSRLLDALDRDAVVTRGRRGVVEDVDVPALLRAWAAGYDVFKRDLATSFIATAGAASALAALASAPGRTAVTGSFAAVRLAAVAAPALLAVYCEDIPAIVDRLGLLPADEGANVILLRPYDEVVWERTSTEDGVSYAAASQIAVDCLTGNGRMPAEGEAVLRWMSESEDRWRLASLP